MKTYDKDKKEVSKETFEKPKVTNIQGKEVALDDKELEGASGGMMRDQAVDGELCLGGG